MLHSQNGQHFVPLLVDDNTGKLAQFMSRVEAECAAESTLLGAEFGYEVFEEGAGNL